MGALGAAQIDTPDAVDLALDENEAAVVFIRIPVLGSDGAYDFAPLVPHHEYFAALYIVR